MNKIQSFTSKSPEARGEGKHESHAMVKCYARNAPRVSLKRKGYLATRRESKFPEAAAAKPRLTDESEAAS